jgi:RimJ/RimL family protein N-acetyltransferase
VTPFVPAGFVPPDTLELPELRVRLQPLGPEHNAGDHAAWTSSVEHIRATPGWEGSSWPRPMTLEQNRDDLVRHRADFQARTGFTYTVLDAESGEVIGCVYLYPLRSPTGGGFVGAAEGADDPAGTVDVRLWVRADQADRDAALGQAVLAWVDEAWPFARVHAPGRRPGP